MEKCDNTAAAAEGGEELKIKSTKPSVDDDKGDDSEESEATTKSDSVNGHTEQSNDSPGEESENTSVASVTSVTDESAEKSETPEDTGPVPPSVSTDDKKSLPPLTLVLIGDTISIEIGPRNILLGHEEQTNVFSSKLYDLCGRHIGVVNMLGQQNTDHIPLNQGTHVFVLLLPNGLHSSHYNKGVQWLEETFGRGALAYLMTIVTHQPGEKSESALEDLKANAGFVEERYSTCTRSMMDEREIVDVLEKIDVMVSEGGLMWGDTKEEKGDLEHKSHEEERTDSEFQKNPTAGETEETDEGKDVSSESSGNMCAPSIMEDTCPTSQTVSTDTEEGEELEESVAKTELKSDPVNEHSESEKSDDSTAAGRQTKPQTPSPAKEKGTLDEDLSQNKEKQSLEISEEINRKKQHERQIETVFIRLDLQETLSPADFLQIGPPVKQHHVTSEKDLAHTFLHRLMMLDYRARYIPVKQDNPEVTPQKFGPGSSEPAETDDSDLEAFLSSDVDTDQSEQTHVHPMDVQMAVFHRSDSLLKQIMITKLSQCQYALPLLVPDPVTAEIECPLWTFRQIRKSWKVTQTQDNSHTVTMNTPICNAETHMVSFFRLGSLSVSKSQLMNTLINERHSTFFHRNCPGSTKSRHLMDGVAEIAWYCPAGKPNDAFNDCIAFCNLHGDALSFQQQRDILIEKSSVNVVLLPALRKDDKSWPLISALLKSEKPLICLTADDTCGVIQTKNGKYKMGLKDRSQSDTSEQLKKIVGQVLTSLDPSSSNPKFRLETMAEVPDIRVDERDTVCQEGKSAAMKMVTLLEKMDVSEIKAEFLPCQGHLWHQWCKVNKELYHLKGHIEKERSKKQQELMQIREEQCAASCSELMKSFIESLASLPPADKVYFLKWTQILIDALSTHDLSSILQDYDKKWSEVLALKNKHDKSALLSRKQTELELISSKLQSATFGLEHIFREMGQIYEAHQSQEKNPQSSQTDWSKYPELAAELLISGHPMELMDGDAGHVPLKWISSVLKKVIKKLGNKSVFVLSVLGIQSSGKSTMLNAMFGLQFAVSAGRCTKGAFMQLVKVSEEIKQDFKFDYVLVVDTEGLRALELAGNASLHHDNELATFVVGLGNLTLINIFGENPAEMQDVLQIVVQAFMRMKKVKLSPSCVFVHQNVTDIAAAEKNMDGKRRLQEKLDQMAQLAAKEEACNAECFSDIIKFDVQRDVKYSAQLWEGSPPMAPPNPGYSESIQELKKIILNKASQTDGISLSGFNSKIQDLWNALLKENFVFSFKNTLEIAAYRKLEVQYGNWTWALRNQMLIIENQLHNRIENGNLDRIEQNYLLREISKTYEDIKKTMTAYFEDDGDKDMLVQWRGRFESKIKEFRDEQAGEVKRKLDEVIHQKNARKKLDNRKTDFENKLLQKSKELAHQLKDKAKDEEQLEEQFNSVWSGWVTELTTDTKPVEDINFEEEQLNVLQELGIDWSRIDEARESGRYKYLTESGDYSDYVILPKNHEPSETSEQDQDDEEESENKSREGKSFLKSVFSTVRGFFVKSSAVKQKHCKSHNTLTYDERQDIMWLIDEAEKESLNSIKSKPVALRGYRSTYLQEVAKKVKEKVAIFQSEWIYVLRKEFTLDLLLYVFAKAESWLLQSQRDFKMNNDALTYLESKKTHYYNIFKSFCKGNSSAVVLGELICEMLKTSIVEAAVNTTAIGLAGEMKCNFPAFSGNRLDLEKHMLKSLAQKENFKGFMKYIRNPRGQAEAFIKAEVKKYIFKDHKDKALNILKKNVDDVHRLVSQALFHATKKVQGGNTNLWLREFFSSLGDELTFATVCSENFNDINNFDFLVEEINKGLKSTMEQMRSLSLNNLKDSRQKPHEILIEQLCRCCWVRCPFCSAVCTNTIEGHSPDDHSVPFHRPSGINGWHYRNTVELCIYFCTTNVASNGSFYPRYDSEISFPYKQYRKAGPEYACWRITPDESKLAYWKWFVCQFQKELEEYHNLQFRGRGEIPPDWKMISKHEAIKSLDEMCE